MNYRLSVFNHQYKALGWLVGLNCFTALLVLVVALISLLAHTSDVWLREALLLPSSWRKFLFHPWTIATYMVTQFSLLQFIFNTLWLFWFGRLVTDFRSNCALLQLYIGGGLLGGICYLAAASAGLGASMWLAGSSAAVLSVMTAAAFICPNLEMRLFLIGNVKLKWIALVTILLTLFAGGASAATQCAHIGGCLFGVLYMYLPKHKWNPVRSYLTRRRELARGRRMARAFSPAGRLDTLLDKVRTSGYNSLTKKERAELDDISKKI